MDHRLDWALSVTALYASSEVKDNISLDFSLLFG